MKLKGNSGLGSTASTALVGWSAESISQLPDDTIPTRVVYY